MMIHGAFCGGWVFDEFKLRFLAAGHAVITPDLPGHGAAAGGGQVVGKSMRDYAASILAICEKQDQPPILIGHSMGGLVAQMVAAKTRISGLILLAPSAPWGVHGATAHEALSAVSLYALGPFWVQPVSPDYSAASQFLFQNLTSEARSAVFAQMTAESGRALWETLNWWLDPFATTLVSAARITAPVLAVAGGRDEIHPAVTVRATADRLGGETCVRPEMGHWLIGEPGWQEVADTCQDWIKARQTLNPA